MITETLWFVAGASEDDIKSFETEDDAKKAALELSEENGDSYFVYKGQSVWLIEPPQEIPATITKIKRK